jgi:DNA-binding transcriptional regulator PaaX
MTARCWDLAQLDRDYGEFVKTYRPMLASIRSGELSPRGSPALRTELVHDYRMFLDPDLPTELLPRAWRGGTLGERAMRWASAVVVHECARPHLHSPSMRSTTACTVLARESCVGSSPSASPAAVGA